MTNDGGNSTIEGGEDDRKPIASPTVGEVEEAAGDNHDEQRQKPSLEEPDDLYECKPLIRDEQATERLQSSVAKESAVGRESIYSDIDNDTAHPSPMLTSVRG